MRQVVVDVVGVDDDGRELFAGRSLAQVAVAKERELQVHNVERPGAQHPIQRALKCRHRAQQPLKAPCRAQGSKLQESLGEAFLPARVGDQHRLATVGLRGLAALLDIELVADQHHRGQVVASRKLRHEPVYPRLRAKSRRAGRHLGNVEDIEARRAHRSDSVAPGTRAPVGDLDAARRLCPYTCVAASRIEFVVGDTRASASIGGTESKRSYVFPGLPRAVESRRTTELDGWHARSESASSPPDKTPTASDYSSGHPARLRARS